MLLFALLLIFVGLAVALAWFLVAHDHGEKEPVLALWAAAGLGLFGAVLAALLESHVPAVRDITPGMPHGQLLASAIMVGLIEESCKFLPLALVIYPKRYFNEHTDGVIYFALAGLGFGLPENMLYTIQFGSKVGLARLLLTPLFHAATTGMVGYFLVKRKLAGKSPLGIATPLMVAVILHGIYDFGLLSATPLFQIISLLVTLGLSGGLFMLYQKATEQDQDEGRSLVGHNNFCRACGFPNPKHHLYCIYCGQHA